MNLLLNRKGFTLIELLAVIVVLSVIMLLASSSVGGMMTKARQNALKLEGESMVDAAKNAYQMGVLEGKITTGSYCFSIQYLYNHNYYEKGATNDSGTRLDDYSGSVLVVEDNGKFTYTFWIGNGSYVYEEVKLGDNSAVPEATTSSASYNCDGKVHSSRVFNR